VSLCIATDVGSILRLTGCKRSSMDLTEDSPVRGCVQGTEPSLVTALSPERAAVSTGDSGLGHRRHAGPGLRHLLHPAARSVAPCARAEKLNGTFAHATRRQHVPERANRRWWRAERATEASGAGPQRPSRARWRIFACHGAPAGRWVADTQPRPGPENGGRRYWLLSGSCPAGRPPGPRRRTPGPLRIGFSSAETRETASSNVGIGPRASAADLG
jgi:hypothetical protein